jgi:hypothetical protein
MKRLFFVVVYLVAIVLTAQPHNIGIKFFGFSIHPFGDENAHIMPMRLDNDAIFVPNVGLMLSFERYIWHDIFSVKAVHANFMDCAFQVAGFSHIGLRIRLFSMGRHELSGGIGPTLMYRKNWYRVNGYDDTNNFYTGGNPEDRWQWVFIWYGGEFEYNLRLTRNIDLSVTVIPGIPRLIAIAYGLRIRMKKKKSVCLHKIS